MTTDVGSQSSTKLTKLQLRDLRRAQLTFHVQQLTADTWEVPSDSTPGKTRIVNTRTNTCTCLAKVRCWHRTAVQTKRDELAAALRAGIDRFIDEMGLERAHDVLKLASRTRRAHTDDISAAPGYRGYFSERAS